MLTILRASAHDLVEIEDKSIHMIATSPPYYGLRSYSGEQDVEWPTVTYRLNEWCEPLTVQGCEAGCSHEWGDLCPDHHPGQVEQTKWKNAKAAGHGQTAGSGRYCLRCGGWRGPLGLEEAPPAYIGHLILCLREWRRVLRDDGVCFVNLGDSYAGNRGNTAGKPGFDNKAAGNGANLNFKGAGVPTGLKGKDLIGIPWLFAFAARADGWWLRSAIVWAKGVSFLPDYSGSVMPESVTDRPTRAHEMVFMLTKSARYYYDAEAVKEASAGQSGAAANFKRTTKENLAPGQSKTQHRDDREPTADNGTRNLRDVWVINPQSYKAAHYATWPEKLVTQMILAGTSQAGCCPQCGAPWRRVVERIKHPERDVEAQRADYAARTGRVDGHIPGPGGMVDTTRTIGWEPSCLHGTEHSMPQDELDADPTLIDDFEIRPFDPIPCKVLDPFVGSGTSARVAVELGREAVASDLSGEYLTEHVPKRTTVQMKMQI